MYNYSARTSFVSLFPACGESENLQRPSFFFFLFIYLTWDIKAAIFKKVSGAIADSQPALPGSRSYPSIVPIGFFRGRAGTPITANRGRSLVLISQPKLQHLRYVLILRFLQGINAAQLIFKIIKLLRTRQTRHLWVVRVGMANTK